MDNHSLLSDLPEDLQQAIAFHGHLCPGLVKGYRAAKEALLQLGVARAEDEELVAIVENDACGVDAFQALTGCTFGKGNLVFRDHGKHVFTLARRSDAAGVRLSAKRRPHTAEEPDSPEARARVVLAQPFDDLFDVRRVTVDLPPTARIHDSIPCEACGEPTMATRIREIDGRKLCVLCSQTVLTREPFLGLPVAIEKALGFIGAVVLAGTALLSTYYLFVAMVIGLCIPSPKPPGSFGRVFWTFLLPTALRGACAWAGAIAASHITKRPAIAGVTMVLSGTCGIAIGVYEEMVGQAFSAGMAFTAGIASAALLIGGILTLLKVR